MPQILDLVEKAGQYKQLKKGANEGASNVSEIDELALIAFRLQRRRL